MIDEIRRLASRRPASGSPRPPTLDELRRASSASCSGKKLGAARPARRASARSTADERREARRGAERGPGRRSAARWPPRRERAGGDGPPGRRLEAERLDLTEVRAGRDAGHLHLVTQTIEELEDVFVGMGFTVAEGPEVENDWHNFTALNFGAAPPGPRHAGHVLRRPRRAPRGRAAHPHLAGADPGDGEPAAADLLGRCPAGCTATRPPTPPTWRCSTRSRAWSSTGASPSATWPAPSRRSPRPTSGAGYAIAAAAVVLPVHRAVGRVRRAAPRRHLAGARRLRDGPPQRARATAASTPRSGPGFAFGFGIDRLAAARHGVADLRELLSTDIRFLEQF